MPSTTWELPSAKRDDWTKPSGMDRRAVELHPEFARAHFNLGLALCKMGNLDGGIAEFKEALKWRPDYPEASQNLETALGIKKALEKPAKPAQP